MVLALGACGNEGQKVIVDPVIRVPALHPVAAGLSRPLFVTAPPGDTSRLFIVEQTGAIRVVRRDSLLVAPFLDLTDSVSCCGERGLLGLAFHPAYAQTGRFYVNYTDSAGTTRVVRYTVTADPEVADPASARPVLTQAQPHPNHNGGMLAFGPDGYLYIALGDGGNANDPQGNAQNLATWLGKLLRIDVDLGTPYAIPPDNPFVDSAGARPEIWAFGLRNPWRFGFDRTTGDLYIADVGQSAREEIDVHPANAASGANYGWDVMEGTACVVAGCAPTGLPPVHEYTHTDGCSITGGYTYRGQALPDLAGAYFYADYCRGWVRSLRWGPGGVTDLQDWAPLAPGGPVSSFGEDARGELYVVAYGVSGTLYRIVPAP